MAAVAPEEPLAGIDPSQLGDRSVRLPSTVTRADKGTLLGEVDVTVFTERISPGRLAIQPDYRGRYTLSDLPVASRPLWCGAGRPFRTRLRQLGVVAP